MAKIIWLDLDDKRHESKEYRYIMNLSSDIEQNKDNIKVVELLDCKGLDGLFDYSMYHGLFNACENLEEVKEVIGTSQVEDMNSMFMGCSSLKSVPLFDTSRVKDMRFMFVSCKSLESVPLFDTSKVEYMSGMFYGCSNLKSVPVFDMPWVKRVDDMFCGCSSLFTETFKGRVNATWLYDFYRSMNMDCMGKETLFSSEYDSLE